MRSIAGTFSFMWLIAAAPMPAKASEAGQPEKSQGGTMQMTQPNIQGRKLSPEDVRTVACARSVHAGTSVRGRSVPASRRGTAASPPLPR